MTNDESLKPLDYDATNAIKKIKLGLMTKNQIKFNSYPEILLHNHDELVEPKGAKKYFKRRIAHGEFELRDFVHFISEILERVYPEKSKIYKHLIKQMEESHLLTQDNFDSLLKDTYSLIEFYNERINIIDTLIETTSKSKKILNAIKTKIQSGYILSDKYERFFEFCVLEFEKNEIYETGIVPFGWLPSDVEKIRKMLKDLNLSIGENNEMTERLRRYALGTGVMNFTSGNR